MKVMSAEDYLRKHGNKRSKYHAEATFIDGIRFASKAEARRYAQLRVMEDNGVIRDLVLQPEYDIEVNGTRVATYKADFAYWDNERNERVVEDVKGVRTATYRLKKKLVEALYGFEIEEIDAKDMYR